LKDVYAGTKWKWINENVFPVDYDAEPLIEIRKIELVKTAEGNRFGLIWMQKIYAELAKDFGIELSEVGRRFGEIRLVEYEEGDAQAYCYHSNLGIYQEV
jgi:hypothetical protein